MSNQSDIIALIKAISGQANVLTIPRVYIQFAKSHRAALMLSQCVYWSDRSQETDGWFYKSYREWKDELGLNQHAIETCVKTLTEGGWMETKLEKVGTRMTCFYKPDLEKIAETIRITLAETAKAETAKVPKRKTLRFHKTETTYIEEKKGAATPPAVTAYREIARRFPDKATWDDISKKVGEAETDLAFWREVVHGYIACGWNKTNLAGMLEWYGRREVPRVQRNGNGARRAPSEHPALAGMRMALEEMDQNGDS